MIEPPIHTAPNPCPPGYGWDYYASRCEANGWAEQAAHAREMARRSRTAGRSLRADEVPVVNVDDRGQVLLFTADISRT